MTRPKKRENNNPISPWAQRVDLSDVASQHRRYQCDDDGAAFAGARMARVHSPAWLDGRFFAQVEESDMSTATVIAQDKPAQAGSPVPIAGVGKFAQRVERIGSATLYLADAWDVLPQLEDVSAVITDPPYSERCHTGHDAGSAEARDGAARNALGYTALSEDAAHELARAYAACCSGWIVWMTDSDLALVVRTALERAGRYAFAPLPFYQPGRSVRLSGDGPSSWTDWIVVARTKAQMKWGTLPGGYVAGPGWNDKARMGGKPTALMESLVQDYSRPGDTVLDSHMGAGTTGVACARTGRKFIGIEIDPEAFELSCRRIEAAYAQRPLFDAAPQPKPEQATLLESA